MKLLAQVLGLLGQAVAALRKRVSSRPLVYFDFRTIITNHYGSAPKPRRRKRKQ
jgi:hypothetical protein